MRSVPLKFQLQMPDSLGLTAWISLILLVLSQTSGRNHEETALWSTISVTVLASCLGLSEIRRRKSESEVRQLRAVATTDSLTGVGNRRWLDIEMRHRLAQYRRQATPLSILMFDVDHFKLINDEYGHDSGDLILKSIAKVVVQTLRDMDVLTRYGGEEFVAVLPGTNIKQAAIAAERIRYAVQVLEVPIADRVIRATISVGVATAVNLDEPSSLLKRADDALYCAKRNGRNRCFVKSNTQSECVEITDCLVLA